jgi:hypothetical protein
VGIFNAVAVVKPKSEVIRAIASKIVYFLISSEMEADRNEKHTTK